MNPKKGHVRYQRRIPKDWVESMDIHLKQLRQGIPPFRNPAWEEAPMTVAYGDLDLKEVGVVTLKDGESISAGIARDKIMKKAFPDEMLADFLWKMLDAVKDDNAGWLLARLREKLTDEEIRLLSGGRLP